MPKVKLGPNRQITLPATTVKHLGLSVGEELEIVEGENAVMLVPRKGIPKDQRWYHTEAWQEMMREAFQDQRRGKMLGPFGSVKELNRRSSNFGF